jgi:hypothetical protein
MNLLLFNLEIEDAHPVVGHTTPWTNELEVLQERCGL